MNLDDAYANMDHIPDGASYPDRWLAAAEDLRGAVRCDLGESYGDGDRLAYDLFHPEGGSKGLLIFVHGGYWLRFDRSYFSQLAEGALACGWTVAMPSYDLCPSVRIGQITQQVAQAVDAIAARIGGPIRLVGHSAGGHLVSRMACTDITLACRDRIERVVAISPVSDLAPLMQTSMNETLRIDPPEAASESPVHLTPVDAAQVTVWVGADERPAFLDQARWQAEAWGCELVVDEGRHHFDVIEGMQQAHSPLMDSILR